jgi:hypothetical protein
MATPVEAVWAAPDDLRVGNTVILDGTASRGDAPIECSWSFENESGSIVWETRVGCRVAMTFRIADTKYVKLTVADADGDSDSLRRSFNVAPPSPTPTPTPAPTSTPAPAPSPTPIPPSTGCGVTVSSTSALVSAARSAANGGVVCVAAGSYGAVALTAGRTGFVTIQPAPGAQVVFSDLNSAPNASYYRVKGVRVTSMVDLGSRASNSGNHLELVGNDLRGVSIWSGMSDILIDHNYLHDGGNLIETLGGSRVTINGNRFKTAGGDAMFITSGWRDYTITDNEISDIRENGAHNDCLQSYLGGTNLVYRGNYLHDNRCQGFFLKDGAVTNVVFENNLLVNNRAPCIVSGCPPGSPPIIQTGDVANLVARRNTVWDNAGGWVFRDWGGGVDSAVLDHNVVQRLVRTDGVAVTENHNILGTAWTGLLTGVSSLVDADPEFVNPLAGDYRLLGSDKGVTWRPADKHFGP